MLAKVFKENLKSMLSGILLGLLVFIFFILSSCSHADFSNDNPKLLNGKRCVLIIAPENFRDEELTVTKDVLIENGAYVDVASVKKGVVKGMLGYSIQVDKTVSELSVDDFDCVVIVGGSGAPVLLKHDEVLDFVKRSNELNKTIGAICLGPMVLAKAGVLESKDATVFKSKESLDVFKENNVNFVDKPLVEIGNIITANGPDYAADFAYALVRLLSENN